jgi:hypothetical protein
MRRFATIVLGLAFPFVACLSSDPATEEGTGDGADDGADDDNGTGGATGQSGPENSDAACMDGVDNDDNGFIDCDDFDCSMNPDVTVCGEGTGGATDSGEGTTTGG